MAVCAIFTVTRERVDALPEHDRVILLVAVWKSRIRTSRPTVRAPQLGVGTGLGGSANPV
jgi:hypothetical protein